MTTWPLPRALDLDASAFVGTAAALLSLTHSEGGLEAAPIGAIGVYRVPTLGFAVPVEEFGAESNVRLGWSVAFEAGLRLLPVGAEASVFRATDGAGWTRFVMKQLRNVPIIPEESVVSPAAGFSRENDFGAITGPSGAGVGVFAIALPSVEANEVSPNDVPFQTLGAGIVAAPTSAGWTWIVSIKPLFAEQEA